LIRILQVFVQIKGANVPFERITQVRVGLCSVFESLPPFLACGSF
jgi:hypothetical protein